VNASLQGTLFGLFFILLLVQIAYVAISWDYTAYIMSPPVGHSERKHALLFVAIFFARVALTILTVFFLALARCEPVSKEEQV
jgi:hypothetical protein